MQAGEIEKPSKHGLFATTRWSMVIAAGDRGSAEGRSALEWLCQRYWYPIYAYARKRGSPPADAEDLVQGFFADLLESGTFSRVTIEGGRFRAFMLGCFRRYAFSRKERVLREMRAAGGLLISLDDAGIEQRFMREFTDARTPEHEFNRAWALTIMERATQGLREECDARGKLGRFAVFQPHVHGEWDASRVSVDSERLGMTAEAFRSTVRRLRERMRDLVIREIRQTVVSSDDVSDELRRLLAVISTAGNSGAAPS